MRSPQFVQLTKMLRTQNEDKLYFRIIINYLEFEILLSHYNYKRYDNAVHKCYHGSCVKSLTITKRHLNSTSKATANK